MVSALLDKPTLVFWYWAFSSLGTMIYYRNFRKYRSMTRWYLQKDCIKLKKYKFLFKEINADGQYIPKEIYYNTLIQSFSFVGYTILVVLSYLLFGEIEVFILSVIYFVVMFVIDSYFDIKIYRKKKKLEKGKIVKSPETLPDSTTDNSKKRTHTATNVKKTKKKREKNRQKKK